MLIASIVVLLAGVSDQVDMSTMWVCLSSGACYPARMSNIFWIMFWKAVVLSVWAVFQEAREKRKFSRLTSLFNSEWDKRRAKQPLKLPAPDIR